MDHILSLLHNKRSERIDKRYSLSNEVLIYVDPIRGEEDYTEICETGYHSESDVPSARKGTYYPSVALSSVLSRYAFLVEWEKMESKIPYRNPQRCFCACR